MRNILFFLAVLLTFTSVVVYAEFNHEEHLVILEGEPCQTCHLEDSKNIVPEIETCKNCHEDDFLKDVTFKPTVTHRDSNFVLEHGSFVSITKYDCASCHEQASCIDCHKNGVPGEMGTTLSKEASMHRSDFIVGHPLMAKQDSESCMSCHEVNYCSDCHTQFDDNQLAGSSHRQSWSNLLTSATGIPHENFSTFSCQTCHLDSVLPAHEWSREHAREARKDLAACQTCHSEGDTCLKCHSAVNGLQVNPHPENWNDIKDKLEKASDGRTCRKCH
ncbi:MAG: cytochrome C [Denitrovibrio sp.]|nr:MAG: cytochrome C [Denitrovibrio sp.]